MDHDQSADALLQAHPLVSQFMKGARRLRPPKAPLVASWELDVVLRSFMTPPFEPLSSLELWELSVKTAVLLAMVSAKRVRELQYMHFSTQPSCLTLAEDGSKAVLWPNSTFLPKVLSSSHVNQPLIIAAFHLPPYSSQESRELHTLCPVRAMSAYLAARRTVRRTEQLLVCYG